ncbi:hypothetical protein [Acanthopleuribacter pedis]|uniref:Uncharacterized protein n=1 Tax=Acanthopleuribacter pedis TaxID=442870 RepID=A0A8J7U5Q3_9BACT|nr:hypothetical protein [Acanthopleuribacter pedis]MBO1320698.1 hypothetical protein [Acanthopleuribacter pedis]
MEIDWETVVGLLQVIGLFGLIVAIPILSTKSKTKTLLKALATQGITPDTAVSLKNGMTAVFQVKKELLGKKNEDVGVWVTITRDPDQPGFPCTVTPQDRLHSGEPNTISAHDKTCNWVLLNQDVMAWMRDRRLTITDRMLQLKLYDTGEHLKARGDQHTYNMLQALSRANWLAEGLTARNRLPYLIPLLVDNPNEKARQKALKTYLDHFPSREAPPEHNGADLNTAYPEYWLYHLDCGGDLTEKPRTRLFQQQGNALPDLFFRVLQRLPAARRNPLSLAALEGEHFAPEAFSILQASQADALAHRLLTLYRETKAAYLVPLAEQLKHPAVQTLMITTLKVGARGDFNRATVYLARYGDRAAWDALRDARNMVPRGSAKGYDKALKTIRKRLGITNQDWGALSLAEPDPSQGALEIAQSVAGDLEPKTPPHHNGAAGK